MQSSVVSDDDLQRFYRAGAFSLRALQDRGFGAERFNDDAAARWRAFRGELTDSHRLDLLLRDGAVAYPLAFAARVVFALDGLADDEPFGRDWRSLPPSKAGAILREAATGEPRGDSVEAVLQTLADIWDAKALPPASGDLDAVGPASRLVVAGIGAVIAIAQRMAGRTGMDFGDQVLIVTDVPSVRQLAGIAAALCGSRATPRCATAESDVAELGFGRATACIIAPDAPAETVALARRIFSELGA